MNVIRKMAAAALALAALFPALSCQTKNAGAANMEDLTMKEAITHSAEPDTAPPPQTLPGGYTLDWNDEFDYSGQPDPAKWDYETGYVRNNELQWYQRDNASVSGGVLLIEGREDPSKERGYTSACVITKNKKHFKYGLIQVRARIPGDVGAWPAIWTLGASYLNPANPEGLPQSDWPACGEVDIMELYRPGAAATRATEPALLSNWCWKKPGGLRDAQWDIWKMPLGRWTAEHGTAAEEWLSRFHLWELSWDEASMRISLDGETVNTLDPGAAVESPPGVIPARPFQTEHYLLLNLAIGGNNGGTPDAQNRWPMKYEIDYVRYYVK